MNPKPMPAHKVARMAAGVTQRHVAERLGCAVVKVKRLEQRAPQKLTVEELETYTHLTGLTPEQVLGRMPLPEVPYVV